MAAAAAKAQQLKPLQPIQVNATQHATVIGGGVAGLRTAIDIAQRGFPVSLIERSPFLGGRYPAWIASRRPKKRPPTCSTRW